MRKLNTMINLSSIKEDILFIIECKYNLYIKFNKYQFINKIKEMRK